MDLNHETGGAVAGWDEVMQSMLTILTTRIDTRVFRREFGSEVPAMVDAAMNDAGVMALYVAVAEAIERWEPRFELTDVQADAESGGSIVMKLVGHYRPAAHRGDLNTVSGGARVVRVLADRANSWRLAA